MSINSTIYSFVDDDIAEVIQFCRDYHLEETKKASGRTGSGPRSFGGEIDAFGPGKLNEIAVAKLLSVGAQKNCLIDNEIYSNYEVGIQAKADIIRIQENNGKLRDPNLHIEVKKISDSDEWLGIRSDQLASIQRDSKRTPDNIFLVYGAVYFDDKKNDKQRDFLGAFLKGSDLNSSISFQDFSNLSDLRCEIHFALRVSDLLKFGHEYKAGDIIPKPEFRVAKMVIRKDGDLVKGKVMKKEYSGANLLTAKMLDGSINRYSEIEATGDMFLIGEKDSNRQFLHFSSDSELKSDFFGDFQFKSGESIFFNIENKLQGSQGSPFKGINDWWIARRKLNKLLGTKVISGTLENLDFIRKEI